MNAAHDNNRHFDDGVDDGFLFTFYQIGVTMAQAKQISLVEVQWLTESDSFGLGLLTHFIQKEKFQIFIQIGWSKNETQNFTRFLIKHSCFSFSLFI